MSDDRSTINLKRGASREFQSLRRRYEVHRDSLRQLEESAPTEPLARSYGELRGEIERTIARLDELEKASPAVVPTGALEENLADTRPRWNERAVWQEEAEEGLHRPPRDGVRGRPVLILALAILLLAALGAVLWWSLRGGGEQKPAAIEEVVVEPEPEAPPPEPQTLSVSPDAHDFGLIRKGTRAVAEFALTNHTDSPISLSIERSQCRCLWYEYDETLRPDGTGRIRITVDGARATRGTLSEVVRISADAPEDVAVAIELAAMIE